MESHVQNVKEHILPHIEKLKAPPADETSDGGGTTSTATGEEGDDERPGPGEKAPEGSRKMKNENNKKEEERNGIRDKVKRSEARKEHEERRAPIVAGVWLQSMPHWIVLKALGLLYIRSLGKRAGSVAEVVAGISGVVGAIADRRLSREGERDNVEPTRAARLVTRHAVEFGLASVLVSIGRFAVHHIRGRGAKKLLRLVSPVNIQALALEDEQRPHPSNPPQTAAEWTLVYGPEIKEMKRMLSECGVELPQERFDDTNAELFRFACACGLKRAETPESRAAAVESAVRRIILACEWMSSYPFVSEIKLRRWERLVAWRGTDAGGCPILLVRLGRALQLCTKDGRLENFSVAIASQVLKGIVEGSKQVPGGPDKFVAVVDCRETTNWSVLVRSREVYRLARRLSDDLAAHFPEHLKTVYLLELPLVARVQLQSILRTLPKDVQDKIVHALSTDESLPITVANLQRRRSCARGLSGQDQEGSEVSFATTEGSMPGQDGAVEEEERHELRLDEQPERDQYNVDTQKGRKETSVASVNGSVDDRSAVEVSNPSEDVERKENTTPGRGPATSIDEEFFSAVKPEDLRPKDVERIQEALLEETSPSGQSNNVNTNLLSALTTADTVSRPNLERDSSDMISPTDSPEDLQTDFRKHGAAESGVSPTIENEQKKGPYVGQIMEDEQMGDDSVLKKARRSSAELPASHRLNIITRDHNFDVAGRQPRVDKDYVSDSVDHERPRYVQFGMDPWAGIASLLSSIISSRAPFVDSRVEIFPPTEKSMSTFGKGPRSYIVSVASENSLSSIPEADSLSEFDAHGGCLPDVLKHSHRRKMEGGIKPLPPRLRLSPRYRKTPAKSSLRRSHAEGGTSSGDLSSHPLRRQSSVSWAEELENIREIESSSFSVPHAQWLLSRASNSNAHSINFDGNRDMGGMDEFGTKALAAAMLLNLGADLMTRLLIEDKNPSQQ